MGFFAKLAHMISLLSLSNIKLARAVTEQETPGGVPAPERGKKPGRRSLPERRLYQHQGRPHHSRPGPQHRPGQPGHGEVCPHRDHGGPEVLRGLSPAEPRGLPELSGGADPQTGEAHQIVHEAKADGSFIEIYSYPLINRSSGKLEGVIEYVRDITERQRAKKPYARRTKPYGPRLTLPRSPSWTWIPKDG